MRTHSKDRPSRHIDKQRTIAVGCQDTPTSPDVNQLELEPLQAGKGPVVHQVSVGGADICVGQGRRPGCDASFSLIAREHLDGSVTGQWEDAFAGDDSGMHVAIDCLSVNGSDAWVSGVITEGSLNGVDLTGFPAIARVRDNGTSMNDPADQVSFSFFSAISCLIEPDVALMDITGQVKVR